MFPESAEGKTYYCMACLCPTPPSLQPHTCGKCVRGVIDVSKAKIFRGTASELLNGKGDFVSPLLDNFVRDICSVECRTKSETRKRAEQFRREVIEECANHLPPELGSHDPGTDSGKQVWNDYRQEAIEKLNKLLTKQ